MQSVQILSVCLDNVSRRLLNCGISVSFSPVPEYLHAQRIQRSVLSIALLMLYLAKWEELCQNVIVEISIIFAALKIRSLIPLTFILLFLLLITDGCLGSGIIQELHHRVTLTCDRFYGLLEFYRQNVSAAVIN